MQKELDQWQRLVEKIEAGLEESLGDSLSELSTYDNHPADIGAETFERSKDLSLLERARTRVKLLQKALERTEHGSMGICQRCGEEIETERLEAIPEAELCASCQKEVEADSSFRERPIEEKILAVPFARTFTDEKDSLIFDGEDAWQAVARFGTSDSPQDVPGVVSYEDFGYDEKIGGAEAVEFLAPADDDPEDEPFFAEPDAKKRATTKKTESRRPN